MIKIQSKQAIKKLFDNKLNTLNVRESIEAHFQNGGYETLFSGCRTYCAFISMGMSPLYDYDYSDEGILIAFIDKDRGIEINFPYFIGEVSELLPKWFHQIFDEISDSIWFYNEPKRRDDYFDMDNLPLGRSMARFR